MMRRVRWWESCPGCGHLRLLHGFTRKGNLMCWGCPGHGWCHVG